jgi:hypothetical protein
MKHLQLIYEEKLNQEFKSGWGAVKTRAEVRHTGGNIGKIESKTLDEV